VAENPAMPPVSRVPDPRVVNASLISVKEFVQVSTPDSALLSDPPIEPMKYRSPLVGVIEGVV